MEKAAGSETEKLPAGLWGGRCRSWLFVVLQQRWVGAGGEIRAEALLVGCWGSCSLLAADTYLLELGLVRGAGQFTELSTGSVLHPGLEVTREAPATAGTVPAAARVPAVPPRPELGRP